MSINAAPQPSELPSLAGAKLLINADGTLAERDALQIEADFDRAGRHVRVDRKHNVMRDLHVVLRPEQEEADARAQQAIADAVEGVIP